MRAVLHLMACTFLMMIFIGCDRDLKGELLQITLHRRAVLDQEPRMLCLNYGDEMWLAYDLKEMHLKKCWKGGVMWNGAAFNNIKTVQPTSYGADYFKVSPKDSRVVPVESDTAGRYQFNYYEFEEGQIKINYTVYAGAKTMEISETPRVYMSEDSIRLERSFSVEAGGGVASIGGNHFDRHEDLSYVFLQMLKQAEPSINISDRKAFYWLERSGCNTCHEVDENTVGPSYQSIADNYDSNSETIDLLVNSIRAGSKGKWGTSEMIPHEHIARADFVDMVKYILSLKKKDEKRERRVVEEEEVAGWGSPVAGVHPAYELIDFRPSHFKPRVGGMTVMPDESLMVSTWDSIGGIFRLTDQDDSVDVQLIASGLAEPLGLTNVGEDIYVMQKHELTRLVDLDDDGVTDRYVCVNNQFGVTPDFHEFSYGLCYYEGRFYGGLGIAMRLMSEELQHADRGTIFSVSDQSDFQIIARGLRQPNGIYLNNEGRIFVTENQGQWVPGCKFIHIEEGHFYGCQYGTGDRFAKLLEDPPAVWLPQDEIGNSPSEPLELRDGPYEGHMIIGDVSRGGIVRLCLEAAGETYQGCVFRFSQGLEAGVNRLRYAGDGGIYVGGVGMHGGWSHKERQFGLQKLKYSGNIPFEMLAIRQRPGGFVIELSAPLDPDIDLKREDIKIRQWHYKATERYGGPKLNNRTVQIDHLELGLERRNIFLRLRDLKEGCVIYFELDPRLKDAKGRALWSGESWYTLNQKIDDEI